MNLDSKDELEVHAPPPLRAGGPWVDRLSAWRGDVVVIDCTYPYVAIGTLTEVTSEFLELVDADMHDLRDSTTSRENYLVKVARYGIGTTRRVLVFRMEHVVGISPLSDVVCE
jgi:hypothetical protein